MDTIRLTSVHELRREDDGWALFDAVGRVRHLNHHECLFVNSALLVSPTDSTSHQQQLSAKPALVNPWIPMSDALDLKHIGKLGEEVCEAGAAIFRCVIQGVNEAEPVSGKLNRVWLEEEIADVKANIELVEDHFELNKLAIQERKERKKANLRIWHGMLDTRPTEKK